MKPRAWQFTVVSSEETDRRAADVLVVAARRFDHVALYSALAATPNVRAFSLGQVSAYRAAARSLRQQAASCDRDRSPFEVAA